MENVAQSPGRVRMRRAEAGGRLHQAHRTTSNNSSTSSDILVAPGQTTTSDQEPIPGLSDMAGPDRPTDVPRRPRKRSRKKKAVKVTVVDGRHATFKMRGHRNLLERLRDEDYVKSTAKVKTEPNASDKDKQTAPVDGKAVNWHSTYSKEQTLERPDIEWLHRGQGRYKPAAWFPKGQTRPEDW